jgi:hypothetical protein
LPLPSQPDELREAVRSGAHHSYFHLPAVQAEGFALPESFANFRYIWSVRQTSLKVRVVALHPDVLGSLYGQLFVFFTRFRLDLNQTCSTCGTPVPLVRVDDRDKHL